MRFMSESTADLRDALREAGHRLTGPRLTVWQVISGTESHMTADQIADQVRALDPTVNLSSIYRSLALFADLGLVRESNLDSTGAAHWEVAHPDEQFHLRCISCGRVFHHTGDLVDKVCSHLGSEHGFRADNIELLVTGLCERCSARGN